MRAMPKLIPLVGWTSGRLTVLRRAPRGTTHNTKWECQCSCGTIVSVVGQNLRNKHTKSCGCLHREIVTRHGYAKARPPEYAAWMNMVNRCKCAAMPNFHRYGGRGIRVCDEWQHDFLAFYHAVGPRPTPKHSIDRIDNNGHYEPGNVRWATPKEQCRNRRSNIRITFRGETLCPSEWAEKTGLSYTAIVQRTYQGWSPERCLTTPQRVTKRQITTPAKTATG